jgi:hypothetical protein
MLGLPRCCSIWTSVPLGEGVEGQAFRLAKFEDARGDRRGKDRFLFVCAGEAGWACYFGHYDVILPFKVHGQ